MKTSEKTTEVMKAIFNVQQAVGLIKKEATGSTGSRTYKYATLDKVWEAATGQLKAEGLVVTQSPTTGDQSMGDFFQTTIYHVPSGEWVQNTMMMRVAKDDPQSIGSAITYYRRYMLVSMLGLIVQGDDTDATEHKLATAVQKARIIGAVKQIFPDLQTDTEIIKSIQNIVGKHPSYIREDEADGALEMVKAFTAKAFEDDINQDKSNDKDIK